MDSKGAGSATIQDLATIVRSIYLERRDSVVEVRHVRGTESLFFRRGELYLDRDHRAAPKITPLLAAMPRESRPAAIVELRAALEELAQEILRFRRVEIDARDGRAMVVETIGPLPAVCLVQELAVYGCGESELLARLGGESVRLRSTDKTPALHQLPGLEPDMAQVLVGLETPTTAAELLRGAGAERSKALQGLTKLWAVGLVMRVDREVAGGAVRDEEILNPKLLDHFTQRIAQDLDQEPLRLPSEAHRIRLAELLSRLGQVNYYELLDIELRADEQKVFAAYRQLARVVHPRHAQRLGLEDKDEAVRVLFERATEAYLTLSDPKRRASYNTMAGIHRGLPVDDAQREQEKRLIALQNYRRASSCIAEMDYSSAVDLLKEAARIDPRPEYFARLAMAQEKNPNWQRHAVESYRRAIDMRDDPGVRFSFGTLLEGMDRRGEAREQFRAVLQVMPDHAGAREALERMGGLTAAAEKVRATTTGGFRSLFGKTGPSEGS